MSETRVLIGHQLEKATGAGQFPLTVESGQQAYANFNDSVKSAETKTTIDSVEVVAGELVIKYTGEDGVQQVKSTSLSSIMTTDINVQSAVMSNPSAGTYILTIRETDGTEHTVNLSDLLAIVAVNSSEIELTGNGTAGSPLQANLTADFIDSLVEYIDDLVDVHVSETPKYATLQTSLPEINLNGNNYEVVLRHKRVTDPKNPQQQVLAWIPEIHISRNITSGTIEKAIIMNGNSTSVLPEDFAINNLFITQPVNLHETIKAVYVNGIRISPTEYSAPTTPGNLLMFDRSYPTGTVILIDWAWTGFDALDRM